MDREIQYLLEQYDDLVKMDGFDDCIIGVVVRFNQEPIICYSYEKVISKLIENDGMSLEEAIEFFEFNQLGSWVGDRTPCFLNEGKI